MNTYFSPSLFPTLFFPKVVFPKAFFPMQDSQNTLFATFVFPNNQSSQETNFPKLLFPIGNSPNVKVPNAGQYGFFHLGQSLYRRVQAEGLQKEYNNATDRSIREATHMLPSLAFVPLFKSRKYTTCCMIIYPTNFFRWPPTSSKPIS